MSMTEEPGKFLLTRAANILAIDDCDALAFASKCPGSDGRRPCHPKNQQIKFFRLGLVKYLSG